MVSLPLVQGGGVRGRGPDSAAVPDAALGALFSRYDLPGAYDEMFDGGGAPREHYRALLEELSAASPHDLRRHQVEADKAFLAQGITFTVYGDAQGTERIFPFDLLPRMLTGARVGDPRARADPAAHRHQHVPARHLSRGTHPRRRRGPA